MPPQYTQPKLCEVLNGCGKLLSRSAHYNHRTTLCCQRRILDNEQAEVERPALEQTNRENEFSWLNFCLMLGLLLWQKLSGTSDRAMQLLLRLIRAFLILVSGCVQHRTLTQLATSLPISLYSLRKQLNLERDDFLKFAVCPKCHAIYPYKAVVSGDIRRCTYVSWPNHTQTNRRRACNKNLLHLRTNSPKRIYTYRSIKKYLQAFVKRDTFVELCNAWRCRPAHSEYLSDVYDGELWNERHREYLIGRHNLLAMINVDWFQPYKHTPYSLGAIYMVILNLPRHERFKEDNVLLLGVIPGPTEPSLNLNSYLRPLVDELKNLGERGVHMHDTSRYGNTYKLRLLGCTSDLPATRKLGGFLSYSAKFGCSKCLKAFPRMSLANGGTKCNYSGFNRQDWPHRNGTDHIAQAKHVKEASTDTERKEREKLFGARWSSLFELTYFNPVTDHAIDPMHCLYLGIAKKMTKYYFKSGLLSKDDVTNIQSTVDKIRVPTTVGRLPRKIASGFSSFTSDQWKSWTLIYSTIALRGKLEQEDYNLWLLCVRAISLVSKKVVKKTDVALADTLFLKFAKGVERKYGPEFCTPNIHMVCHLKDSIKDYGSVYSFWCYSFERYNGMLSNYWMNNHDVSVQVMRKFLLNHQLQSIPWPDNENNQLSKILTEHHQGTLSAIHINIDHQIGFALSSDFTNIDFCIAPNSPCLNLPDDARRISSFVQLEKFTWLSQMYDTLYNGQITKIHRRIEILDCLEYNGEVFRADNSGKVNCNVIKAKWLGEGYPLEITAASPLHRAGMIRQIFISKILIRQQIKEHIILKVDWFNCHEHPYNFGNHLQTYYRTFCDQGPHTFLPIQRVLCKCALHACKHAHMDICVVIPLPGQWGFC